MTHHVFVYGTMKRGFRDSRVLQGSEFVGVAQSARRYDMLDVSAFPGAVSGGGYALRGEVFQITDETLRRLDHVMGRGLFFSRDEITVKVSGRIMTTWVYLFRDGPGHYAVVPSTDGTVKEWTRRV